MYYNSTPPCKVAESELIGDILTNNDWKVNSALSIIYKKHYPIILNFVVRNGGDSQDAKDIFQETVIVLFKNIRQGVFRFESTIGTYLFAVAKNKWFLTRNNKIVSKSTEELIRIYEETCDPFEENIECDSETQKIAAIRKGMRKIKSEEREVIKDYYFKNMTHEEISLKYKLGSTQASKNKKCRAMNELKKRSQVVAK